MAVYDGLNTHRWLRRGISCARVQLHPGGRQRLRCHPGLARAARNPGHPARLPEGSRTADPVDHRRARQGVVDADHQGCDRLPRFPAQANTAGTLGRTAAATHGARLAAVCGQPAPCVDFDHVDLSERIPAHSTTIGCCAIACAPAWLKSSTIATARKGGLRTHFAVGRNRRHRKTRLPKN